MNSFTNLMWRYRHELLNCSSLVSWDIICTVNCQVTMPQRGKPEPPQLNYGNYEMTGATLGETGILEWDSDLEYHLSWQLPEDNGLPIDMFLLQYFPVGHTLDTIIIYFNCFSMIRFVWRCQRREIGKGPGKWLRRRSAESPQLTRSSFHIRTPSSWSSSRLTMSSDSPMKPVLSSKLWRVRTF